MGKAIHMEREQPDMVDDVLLQEFTEEQITQLQANLIELAHDAIFIRDPASRIISWNQGAQLLYGWAEQEVLGKVSHELFHTSFPVSREAIDQVLMQQGHWEGQLAHQDREGNSHIVDSRQVFISSLDGSALAILEVNRDITEQVRLLEERAQAQAAERAWREMASQMNDFLGIISHELKTPLTSVSGNVQLARRQFSRLLQLVPDLSNIPQSEMNPVVLIPKFLERAEGQIQLQSRLVNDLVDASRIENNQLYLQMEPSDLVEIVRSVVEEQRALTPLRVISLDSQLEEAGVMADGDRIGQVLHNYLSNALKYSAEGKSVAVKLEQQGEMWRVSVQDHGPGLLSEEQTRIWERFFRGEGRDIQSGSGVGLGLGLYICRTLIERQGGQVGVESEPGNGSTFWFTLPVLHTD